jgi:hypothetical protein
MNRQPSQRTREQVIRSLHNLQGHYPGLAGDRVASFRFRPDGRLLVGWGGDEEGSEAESGALHPATAASSSSSSSAAPNLSMDGEDLGPMSLDEQEAQRAAFAQFERENELRRARQQHGGHRPEDEDDDGASAAASGSTGGLWNMLGGALRRHVDNAGQGVPFPLSVMLDPAQVRQRLGEGGGAGGGTIVGHDLGDGRGMRFSFSSSSGGHPTFFGFRRRPLQQAELDVDNLDYEQLLQLEEALGSVKPKIKAAERGQIEALPVREWHKKPTSSVAGSAAAASSSASAAAAAAAPSPAAAAAAADQGEECSICMCEFEEGDAVKTLPCFHSFHAASVTQPLSLSRYPTVTDASSLAHVQLSVHGSHSHCSSVSRGFLLLFFPARLLALFREIDSSMHTR